MPPLQPYHIYNWTTTTTTATTKTHLWAFHWGCQVDTFRQCFTKLGPWHLQRTQQRCLASRTLFMILSNFSTSEIATSYSVKGHLLCGKSPNCNYRNFHLPGKKVLSMVFHSLRSATCPWSLNVELYHLPKLFTGFSAREGITSPSL